MVTSTNGTAHSSTDIEGTVGRVNERGFTLAGRDGWLNVSKFAGGLAVPSEGAHVLVTLDKSGFVREVETLGSTAQDAPHGAETGTSAPVGKDRRIMRMASINSAIALLNNHGPASVADVLDVAAQLEAWVTR